MRCPTLPCWHTCRRVFRPFKARGISQRTERALCVPRTGFFRRHQPNAQLGRVPETGHQADVLDGQEVAGNCDSTLPYFKRQALIASSMQNPPPQRSALVRSCGMAMAHPQPGVRPGCHHAVSLLASQEEPGPAFRRIHRTHRPYAHFSCFSCNASLCAKRRLQRKLMRKSRANLCCALRPKSPPQLDITRKLMRYRTSPPPAGEPSSIKHDFCNWNYGTRAIACGKVMRQMTRLMCCNRASH